MAPVDGENAKRYCAECNKCVVDLRGLNNKQIRKLYIQSNKQLCGVLPCVQSKETSSVNRFTWFFSVLVAAVVAFFRGEVSAQNKVEKKEVVGEQPAIHPIDSKKIIQEAFSPKEIVIKQQDESGIEVSGFLGGIVCKPMKIQEKMSIETELLIQYLWGR